MTVLEQLKSLIEEYFKRCPQMSINGLAKRTGVGATTIRRILNDELKGEPAPHTILNIVSILYKEKRLPRLLKMIEGPIGEVLAQAFSAYVYQDTDYTYSPDLNMVLRDKVNYLIYKLAANQSGATITQLRKIFGELGLGRVKEMTEMGLLTQNEDGSIHAVQKNFSLDVSLSKEHLPELARFFKPEEAMKGFNIYYTISESLNEWGVQQIRAIQKEAVEKISQVVNDRKYWGTIPYFTINLGDTLELSESKGETI